MKVGCLSHSKINTEKKLTPYHFVGVNWSKYNVPYGWCMVLGGGEVRRLGVGET